MKAAVITFPGSNCERDVFETIERTSNKKPLSIWHTENTLPSGLDLVVLPGGFSYGDYLRSGAIAARSPIMNEIIKFANSGGYVIGICNGFQVLTESKLLPGALVGNRDQKFICKTVNLKVENNQSVFTKKYLEDEVIRIPIAHHDGNYFTDSDSLKRLNDNNQIAFRYCAPDGDIENCYNPNGSIENIAGLLSENKRVLGMMPHPERASDKKIGKTDGLKLFQSILENL